MDTKTGMRGRLWAMCALLGAATLAGCGGSGGGGAATSASTDGTRATVILTDSPREDYGHVWATIYKVDLVSASGETVTVFDEADGRQIDLKTLRDASGERYAFLSSASVPQGSYTGVNVTVGATMQLFRGTTATGDPLPVDSSVPRDASGNPVLSLTFRSPKTLGTGATNVVVDFNLARFVVRDSKVLPIIGEGEGTGVGDPARHNADDYRGTVSGVSGTAPALTFTLTRRDGTTVTVATSASTALFGNGAIADSAQVNVRGTLDTTTQTLTATEVEVRGANQSQREPRVIGAVTDLNADAGTFTLTPQTAQCITPTTTALKVVVTDTTTYRGDAGATQAKADFFTALATTPNAAVEGTVDTATNTLTATSVKVVDPAHDRGGPRNADQTHNSGPNGDGPGGGQFRPGSSRATWGNGTLAAQ